MPWLQKYENNAYYLYETVIKLKNHADDYNKNKHRKGEEINEHENPFSTQGT